jgi:hypothetical protein
MVKALEGGGLTPCVSSNFGGRELVSGYELKYLPGLHRLLVKSAHRQISERACSPPAPNSYLAALPLDVGYRLSRSRAVMPPKVTGDMENAALRSIPKVTLSV